MEASKRFNAFMEATRNPLNLKKSIVNVALESFEENSLIFSKEPLEGVNIATRDRYVIQIYDFISRNQSMPGIKKVYHYLAVLKLYIAAQDLNFSHEEACKELNSYTEAEYSKYYNNDVLPSINKYLEAIKNKK